jgi:nicotinate phosphoribosyltransferase
MAEIVVTDGDLEALAAQHDPKGERRFSEEFLAWLATHGHFRDLEVQSMAEGRVVHPRAPIITVTGPLATAQLLETALLNQCNYPTLIATKAARVVQSARGGDVLEFGMRRGPGAGVDEAARAALIGGCSSTSNVQASIALGTDPKGTHAHSLVQAYLALGDGEVAAFRAFAHQYPNECILLVDTLDTLRSGVPNAITVFEELRAQGYEPGGIRLDSGDLAHLAVEAARMLNDAGFEATRIVLSGDLDEITIWQILTQIADEAPRSGLDPDAIRRRLLYGVGTKLITSAGASALDGVYKLTAIQDRSGDWMAAVKLSESQSKIPVVGPKRCWRLYDHRGTANVDLLTMNDETPFDDRDRMTVHHPFQAGVRRELMRADITQTEELHQVVLTGGAFASDHPSIRDLQARCRLDIDCLDAGVRRLVNPHTYHVSLSDRLYRRQQDTVARLRRAQRPIATAPESDKR